MWPFKRNVELSETRKRILCMMDEYAEKDRQLVEIQPFIDLITKRALIIRQNYLEVGNEIGDFEVNENEMSCIKRLLKLLSGEEKGTPVMFLGMDVVVV